MDIWIRLLETFEEMGHLPPFSSLVEKCFRGFESWRIPQVEREEAQGYHITSHQLARKDSDVFK